MQALLCCIVCLFAFCTETGWNDLLVTGSLASLGSVHIKFSLLFVSSSLCVVFPSMQKACKALVHQWLDQTFDMGGRGRAALRHWTFCSLYLQPAAPPPAAYAWRAWWNLFMSFCRLSLGAGGGFGVSDVPSRPGAAEHAIKLPHICCFVIIMRAVTYGGFLPRLHYGAWRQADGRMPDGMSPRRLPAARRRCKCMAAPPAAIISLYLISLSCRPVA